MTAMDEQGQKITSKQAREINNKNVYRSQYLLHDSTETVQRKHVEQEMGPVDMQEARHKQTPVFAVMQHTPDFEKVAIKKRGIAKPLVGNQNVGGNQGQRDDLCLHGLIR